MTGEELSKHIPIEVMHMHNITIAEFMATVFPPDEIRHGHAPLLSYPEADYYRQLIATPRACRDADRRRKGWLFCVSTVVVPEPGGKAKRSMNEVREAWVIVFDDIGTKATVPPVAPSYILETSPGNHQYGYILHPFDVSHPKGQMYFDSCLIAAADAGWSDPGVRSATRVVKLPGAVHKTGFITRTTLWEPDRVWDLPDLMAEMGLKPKQRAKGVRALKPGKHSVIEEVEDEIYDWLKAQGLLDGQNNQFVYLPCPWQSGHTDGARGSLSSTSYSPLDYGRAGRGFSCLHGSCQERNIHNFLAWVAEQGGPDLSGTSNDVSIALASLLGAKA